MEKVGMYIFHAIFGIAGTVLIIFCISVTKSNIEFEKKAVEISGVIMDIRSYFDDDDNVQHDVYVNYQYNGRRYEYVQLNYYSSSMREREAIKLKIDPDNPRIVKAERESLFVFLMTGGMGIAFSLFGYIPLISLLRDVFGTDKVSFEGKYIYGIVERIDIDYSCSANGEHPYILYCYYNDIDTGKIYEFKSDYIWTDPRQELPVGSQVRIYVKNKKYTDYSVDVKSYLQNVNLDNTQTELVDDYSN